MKERVYLDSTIPSYYFDDRESLSAFVAVTRKWWSDMSTSYDLFVSDAVIQELNAGNYPRKAEIVRFAASIPLLASIQALDHIVEFYIDNYVMEMRCISLTPATTTSSIS